MTVLSALLTQHVLVTSRVSDVTNVFSSYYLSSEPKDVMLDVNGLPGVGQVSDRRLELYIVYM